MKKVVDMQSIYDLMDAGINDADILKDITESMHNYSQEKKKKEEEAMFEEELRTDLCDGFVNYLYETKVIKTEEEANVMAKSFDEMLQSLRDLKVKGIRFNTKFAPIDFKPEDLKKWTEIENIFRKLL